MRLEPYETGTGDFSAAGWQARIDLVAAPPPRDVPRPRTPHREVPSTNHAPVPRG